MPQYLVCVDDHYGYSAHAKLHLSQFYAGCLVQVGALWLKFSQTLRHHLNQSPYLESWWTLSAPYHQTNVLLQRLQQKVALQAFAAEFQLWILQLQKSCSVQRQPPAFSPAVWYGQNPTHFQAHFYRINLVSKPVSLAVSPKSYSTSPQMRG